MCDAGTLEFLAGTPLFTGEDPEGLVDVARALRRRPMAAGEVLWREGEPAHEMVFVVAGAVVATVAVAAGRCAEIWRGAPGEPVGELALLDGGVHSATVTAVEPSMVLALARADLMALLGRMHPLAFRLKRRLISLASDRLRRQLRHLAAPLGDDGPPAGDAPPPALEPCRPPASAYLRRMATFHDFDSLALWGFLTSGRYARCPAGTVLLAEGGSPTACYLTVNGAVEKVIVRGGRRLRVGLAGPGKAFGYEGLVDGLPSPLTVVARERALLLVLSSEAFGRLFDAEDAISRVFLDVIQRDMVATLRQAR